jgi:glucose-1-phosphate thymidylyltransferase
MENSLVIQPCFIGENAILKNSVIGPHVSIGANTSIESSSVSNSIIQTHCKIRNVVLSNSMIGNFVTYLREAEDVSLGDYAALQ